MLRLLGGGGRPNLGKGLGMSCWKVWLPAPCKVLGHHRHRARKKERRRSGTERSVGEAARQVSPLFPGLSPPNLPLAPQMNQQALVSEGPGSTPPHPHPGGRPEALARRSITQLGRQEAQKASSSLGTRVIQPKPMSLLWRHPPQPRKQLALGTWGLGGGDSPQPQLKISTLGTAVEEIVSRHQSFTNKYINK